VRRADAELDHFEPALHVALGVGQGLAMLAAQRLGQLVHVAVQQADEFHHHPRALRCGLVAAQPGCACASSGARARAA
jgi:hypothetical protein